MQKVLFVCVLVVLCKAILSENSSELSRIFQNDLNGNYTWRANFQSVRSGLETELFRNLKRLGERNNTDNSNCYEQLTAIASALQNNQIWALKFLDAWGKFPSGLLWGNSMEFGNFDECLSLTHIYNSNDRKQLIEGKYCIASIPLNSVIENISSEIPTLLPLKIGICVPKSCDTQFFNTILTHILSDTFNVTVPSAVIEPEKCSTSNELPFEVIDWIAISLFSFIALLVVGSTTYDWLLRRSVKDKTISHWDQLLCTFSLRVNLNVLFKITPRKSSNNISCLDGIRCLSIIWIIFGHCYMMNILLPSINPVAILQWAQTPFSMFMQSGTISVDSFFFLSGLLLVWVSTKEIERNKGKLNILLMYLHRYIRLTPVIAVAILFFVSLFRHMGNGPLWKDFTSTYTFCHETWWANLLYVQNYAAAGRMCLGHTWYLAIDMQFYILSPLILIPLYKWGKKAVGGVVILGLLMVACVFTSIVINNYVVFSTTGNLGTDTTEMRKIYYATHARTSPWLIGIICGYFLYKNRGRRIKLTNTVLIGGWLVSLALFAAGLFALYPKTLPGAEELTIVEGAFYLTLSRVAWPLGLSWVVFACYNGYGGFANTFLSWSWWQPIARLSYCMYIFHLLVESINSGRIKVNTHFSDYDTILRFWGDFGITIMASLIVYVTFESPLIGIERFLFKSKRDSSVKNATQSNLSLCGNES